MLDVNYNPFVRKEPITDPDVQSLLDKALCEAVFDDFTSGARILISAGANPNAQNHYPLQTAALKGNSDMVSLLLDANNIEITANALENAAIGGHCKIFEQLHDRYPRIHENPALNAMRKAADYDQIDFIKFIIEPNIKASDVLANLKNAIRQGPTAVKEALKETESGESPQNRALLLAAAKGDVAKVATLLQEGKADPRYLRCGPMRAASVAGYSEVIKLLLEDGRSEIFNGSLEGAALEGHLEVFKIVYKRYCEKLVHPNENPLMDSLIREAFRWAARRGHTDIIKFLLGLKHFEQNLVDSVLEEACACGKADVVKLLLEDGRASKDKAEGLSDTVKAITPALHNLRSREKTTHAKTLEPEQTAKQKKKRGTLAA